MYTRVCIGEHPSATASNGASRREAASGFRGIVADSSGFASEQDAARSRSAGDYTA